MGSPLPGSPSWDFPASNIPGFGTTAARLTRVHNRVSRGRGHPPGPVAAGVAAGVARIPEPVTRPVAAASHGANTGSVIMLRTGVWTGHAGAGRGDRPAAVATWCVDHCVGPIDPLDLHLKVVLIRAPLDVEAVGEACRPWLRNEMGPLESAFFEGFIRPVFELPSKRHFQEVCNLRERDSDNALGSVRTERRVCHRRNPSADLCAGKMEERLSAQKRDKGQMGWLTGPLPPP